jgi:hypothetical protein
MTGIPTISRTDLSLKARHFSVHPKNSQNLLRLKIGNIRSLGEFLSIPLEPPARR